MWIWAPQLESTNRARLGDGTLGLDFALLDPAAPGSPAITGARQPNPAESSRQPGYESRVSYSLPLMDRPFTVGAGGYYSRQTYPGNQHIDAWAGTADWKFPFTRWLQLSGELYRGRALGGLGAGTFKDYLTDPDSGAIRGLDDEGGWSQLKAKMTSSLEANFAIGEDAGFSSQLRYYTDPTATDIYTNLARNRTVLANKMCIRDRKRKDVGIWKHGCQRFKHALSTALRYQPMMNDRHSQAAALLRPYTRSLCRLTPSFV